MNKREKAESFEGMDILRYLQHDMEAINDDELTKGRIRSIYVQLKYGRKSANEIAEYYDLPIEIIHSIRTRRIFRDITIDIE